MTVTTTICQTVACLYVPGSALIIYSSTVPRVEEEEISRMEMENGGRSWEALQLAHPLWSVFCIHNSALLGPRSSQLNACPPETCKSKEAGARPLGHDSNSCSSSQVMPSDTETDRRNGPFKVLAFQFGFSFVSTLNVS